MEADDAPFLKPQMGRTAGPDSGLARRGARAMIHGSRVPEGSGPLRLTGASQLRESALNGEHATETRETSSPTDGV
ncbi:hypothetical protein MRX96_016869 [Rhipicephalus microplus]